MTADKLHNLAMSAQTNHVKLIDLLKLQKDCIRTEIKYRFLLSSNIKVTYLDSGHVTYLKFLIQKLVLTKKEIATSLFF